MTSDDQLSPKEESSIRKGSVVHDKSQVDIEGEPKTEPKSRQTIDEEKVVYQRFTTNDVAKNKVDYSRVANITSRGEEGFGKRLLKTSGNEGVSIIEACMIKKGKECEAFIFEEITTVS